MKRDMEIVKEIVLRVRKSDIASVKIWPSKLRIYSNPGRKFMTVGKTQIVGS